MSNYQTTARRKGTEEWETVSMLDDYFGRHQYGVQFPDGKVCSEDEVEFQDEEKTKTA